MTTGTLSWEQVVLAKDIEYGNVEGRSLTLNLLRPRTRRAAKLPVIVWVHGGWWRAGTALARPELLVPLVEAGYIVAAIEYRLTPEAGFPAQIEDCKCAVRYLRAHAERLGIDTEHIGAWGSSAGGHLVALMGTAGDEPGLEGNGGWSGVSSRVQAVVDWYGPSDVLKVDKAFASAWEAAELLLGGPPEELMDLAAVANPITHISDACPPFLIMHGDQDSVVPLNQSELLHEALQRAGRNSRLVVVPGKGHEPLGDDAVAQVHAFFDRHLRPRAT